MVRPRPVRQRSTAAVTLDGSGRITAVGAHLAAFIGAAADDWLGRGIHELLLPEIDKNAGGPEGISLAQDLVIVATDGSRRPVDVELTWHDGAIDVAISPRSTDDAAGRLRRVQALAGLGVWEIDMSSDVLTLSEGLLDILGETPVDGDETPLGAAYFQRFIIPEDQDKLADAQATSIATGDMMDVDVRIDDASGKRKTLRIQALTEYNADGEPTTIYGVAQDVTFTRSAEADFRTLLEGAPDPIVLADADGIIRFVNETMERVLGYTPADLLGQPVEVLVPSGLRQRHKGHRAGYMAHAKPRPMGQGVDLKALHKDGHEVLVEISLSPLKMRQGAMVMAALRDATERRLSEQADRLAFERLIEIQQLREADRAKTTLLNVASHELKTPLTPLRLQLYLLDSGRLGELNDKQQHAVDVLRRNTERLSALIADVLDMARIDSGHITLSPKLVPATQIIDEALEPFEEAMKTEGLTVTIHVDDDTQVYVDPDRAVQVLINFLSNAIKFSKPGGALDVRAKQGGGEILFEVQDHGAGISPDKQAQLFQPFGQVHEEGSVSERGTGLGLYICKGIVEKHGGTVGVSSEGAGKGSTFWMRLPATAKRLEGLEGGTP